MSTIEMRNTAMKDAIHRNASSFTLPVDPNGNTLRISDYYGELAFDIQKCTRLSQTTKDEFHSVATSGKALTKELAEEVAKAVTEWAISKGATHFTHWFQPLTGATAEKHDSFLDLKKGVAIERLSASQLMQGEPDASSFPNGGSRSTFEARGYTSWDLLSPMFLTSGKAGKTLCIPTAFVSYKGEALDIKTPLLRSTARLNEVATEFLKLADNKDVPRVVVNCGIEQEYFLVDKAFYFSRPDLVMTGRTLFGSSAAKNQQLDDHYFGAIPARTLAFMEELDYELHRVGIPSKTRHNEVAPGQFEMAPIFSEANIAADNNQLVMATLKSVAIKHDFVVLLHEKPFAGINGNGKHVNWSMSTSEGVNLLEPGHRPHSNKLFLASTSIVIEAVHRHAKMLRMAIASHSNDHRLGANEAPPSIISVYLGDTLNKIFAAIKEGKEFSPESLKNLDLGADQLVDLLQDNTDRNRTSPFAFTGNKFEFRAVGSTAAVGLPISILNAAVASVFEESNAFLKEEKSKGIDIDESLSKLTKRWIDSSWKVVFNGDGYSNDWVKEAAKRGLPNLRTTADALPVLKDIKETSFLTEQGIFSKDELETRYNVLIERYNLLRNIEFVNLKSLVLQNILPSAMEYKQNLSEVILGARELEIDATVEFDIYKNLNKMTEVLYSSMKELEVGMNSFGHDEQKTADIIANKLLPLSEKIAEQCNAIEETVPTEFWSLSTYYDLLFLR